MTSRGKAAAPHESATPRAPAPVADLDVVGTTPILREYRAVKAEFPDAIVLARLGDFFELFGPDAEIAAPILGVALTGRGFGNAGRLPMCGVPHHSVTGYIRRLLEAGHRVCLWDQIETAEAAGRNLVRREVTRVLGPGTVVDDDLLEVRGVARCVALLQGAGRVGYAALDASTGELQIGEVPGTLDESHVAEELERLDVAELLLPEGVAAPATLVPGALRGALPAQRFDSARGAERLLGVTGTATLRGFGAEGLTSAHGAAAAVLAWADRARLRLGDNFVRLRVREGGVTMRLDAATRRNLELVAPLGSGSASLLRLLDHTATPMGARLLRTRLQEPLIDPGAIDERLDAVEALVAARDARVRLVDALVPVRDVERLVGRCVGGIASPRDLGALRDACAALPACREAVATLAHLPTLLVTALDACIAPGGLTELLTTLLVDEPPSLLRDGGVIRDGADADLDTLRAAGSDARTFIAGLEAAERARSGIRSLKVGYNRVFGYYLEVPNSNREEIPAVYIRKQTLVGAERYITPDLKEQESIVLQARERAVAREAEIVRTLTETVAAHARELLVTARGVAEIDVAASLARVAERNHWVRPTLDSSTDLSIVEGRHPLVESGLPHGRFVANPCDLDTEASRLIVLTGPNMAGKSTFLRQCAVIVLLAQTGSFVPAQSARVGVVDRIFTRVGAQDDIGAGLSTFMVEMAETAHILNTATRRSLVILDEIGRGTSTYDGLSIAQAVAEYLHDAPHLGCRTLFATHYHELTVLAGRLRGVINARVEVAEKGDAVTFLHRIVPGGADRSYGIHVARLAGVPSGVLVRARAVLSELEASRPLAPAPTPTDQLALSLPSEVESHPVVEQLAALDLEELTPLAALNKLAEWREQLRG